MVVFVTLFATNFIEVQQSKKGVIFAGFLLEGVCFHEIKLSHINEKSSKFAIIRSYVNFIPHGYFKDSFFVEHFILNQLTIL